MAGAQTPNPSPDPHPRTPRLRLPPGACDCHAHVFGPRERYPLAASPGYLPAVAPFASYLRMLRSIGCSRAVLVQPSPYGVDHSALLDALRAGLFPLRGIAVIDDTLTDRQLSELHFYGVQGVRVHLLPETYGATLATLPHLAERIRPFGWHLQLYLDAERTPDVDRALLQLPVPVVIDHFGLVPAAGGLHSPGFETLLRLARSDRCWFKLSAPYRASQRPPNFPDVAPMAQALVAATPTRCVWGTDWPHPNAAFMPNDGDLVDLLAAWIPDAATRHRVLVDNPSELYGF
jgi:predicted TIM-barrel fold metal-dependent hydrolase